MPTSDWTNWKPGDPIPPGPPPSIKDDPLGYAHYQVATAGASDKAGPGTTVSSKGTAPSTGAAGDKAVAPQQRTQDALSQHLSTGATGTPLSSLLNDESKPTNYGAWSNNNAAPGSPTGTGNATPPRSTGSGYTPYAPQARAASGPYLAGDLVGRTIGIDEKTRVDPYSGQRYSASADGTWRASGFVGRDEMAGLRTAGAMPPVAETLKNDTANSVAMSANPMLKEMGGTAGLLGNLLPAEAPHFSSLGDFRLPGVGFNAADYKPMNMPNLDSVRLPTPVAQRPYGQDFGAGAPGAKAFGPASAAPDSQRFQVPNGYMPGPSGFSIPDNGGAFKAFAMPFGVQSPTFSALTQSAPAQIQPNATRDPATGSFFSPVGPGLPMGGGMERMGGGGALIANGTQTADIRGGGLGMGFNADTILKDYGRDNVSQDAATRMQAALALMDKNASMVRDGSAHTPLDAYLAMMTPSTSNYGAPVASFNGTGGAGNAGSTAAGEGAYGPDGPDRGFSKGGTVNVRRFAKGGAVSTLPMGGSEYPFGGESSNASITAPPPEFGTKNGLTQQPAPQPVSTGPTAPQTGVVAAAPNPVQQALNPTAAPVADPNTPTFNNPGDVTGGGATGPGIGQRTVDNPNGDPNTHPTPNNIAPTAPMPGAAASADTAAAPPATTGPDLSPYQNALTKLSVLSRQRNAGLGAYKQAGLAAPTGVDSIGEMNVDQLPAGVFYDPSALIKGRVGDIVSTQKNLDVLGNPSDPSTYLSQLAPIDADLARYNQAQGIQTKLQGLGAPEDLQGLLSQQNTLQATLSRLSQARDIQTKLSGIGQTGDLAGLGSQIAGLESQMAPYQAVRDLTSQLQSLGDTSADPAWLQANIQMASGNGLAPGQDGYRPPDANAVAALTNQLNNTLKAQQIKQQIATLDPSGQAIQKLGEIGAQIDQLKNQQGNWQQAADLRNQYTNQLSGLMQPGEDVPGALAVAQSAMSPLATRIANTQQNADLRTQYGNQLSGLIQPGEDISTALGRLQGQRGGVQLNLDNANKAMGLKSQMSNLLSLGVPGAGKLPGFALGGSVRMGYTDGDQVNHPFDERQVPNANFPQPQPIGVPMGGGGGRMSGTVGSMGGPIKLPGSVVQMPGSVHRYGKGGSMVTPEPIVGIGTQTGKPRFIVGEPKKPGGPPMKERLTFPGPGKLKIKPLNKPALPMGGGRVAA